MAGLLPALPDAARVWTFAVLGDVPVSRPAGAPELGAELHASVHEFTRHWASHGRPVPADAADVTPPDFPGAVLAVAAQLSDAEVNAGVSGCGIDAMQHAVEAAVAVAGARLVPALTVGYRDADGRWQVVSRPAFRALTKQGEADGATPVLDLTATTLGALRTDGVERAAGEAWHGRAFRLSAPA